MKAATVVSIRKELKHKSDKELMELCLRLSRFKKENKELLTYLLFESDHEAGYIEAIKEEMDLMFETMNTSKYFYIKKSVRKILRYTKKYIRYSLNKETEVELLMHFCIRLRAMKPSINNNITLSNIYDRQRQMIKGKILKLHEDLQYDYSQKLESL